MAVQDSWCSVKATLRPKAQQGRQDRINKGLSKLGSGDGRVPPQGMKDEGGTEQTS